MKKTSNKKAWWILFGCVCAFLAMWVFVSQAKRLRASDKRTKPPEVLASPAGMAIPAGFIYLYV